MLEKLSSLFQSKRCIPIYEGPIQKRIVQLTILRDEAQNLINICERIINSFDEGDPPLQNTAESTSTCIKMLAEVITDSNRDYSTFLNNTASAFEGIGAAQRMFRHDLEEQVTGPFKSWIITDFTRISNEIKKLHQRKYDFEDVELDVKKCKKDDDEKTLKLVQAKMEYQRQMDAVKHELSKLTKIKDYHSDIFKNFLRIYGNYQQGIINVIKKIGVDKWDIQEDGIATKSTNPAKMKH